MDILSFIILYLSAIRLMTIFMELINEDDVSVEDKQMNINLPKPVRQKLTEHEKRVNKLLGVSND